MRGENFSTIIDKNFNIIVDLHPTDGTNWIFVIIGDSGEVYYFNSVNVETPTLFLEDYVDL